jgi:DNA-binding NarL/FixJ family response regulator
MRELPLPPSAWPLIGRKEALDEALRVLDAGGRGVVIAGPAGVGRTRLVQEVARAAARRGFRPSGLSGAEAVPAGAGEPLPGAPARPEPDRPLLVVDDAHRLAPASARSLGRRVTSGEACALLSVVDGEPAPEAIRELWRDGSLGVLEVAPLRESEFGALVEAALEAGVERGTQRLLWRACAANLVWLRELLQEGLRRGALERRAGVWRWTGPVALGMALRDLLIEPLARLPDAARRALEAVALLEPVELSLLADLLPEAALELLERRGLVSVERDQRRRSVCVRHLLVAECVRDTVPETSAIPLRGAIGRALVSLGLRRHGDRLRAARLLFDGDPAAGMPLFARAGEEAWAAGEPALAERLARAALGGPDDGLARYVLAEAIADQGRFDEALAEWDALEAHTTDESLRLRAASGRAAILHFARGRTAEAHQVLARAAEAVGSSEGRYLLAAMRGVIEMGRFPPERLLREMGPLLEATALPPQVEARAYITLFSAAGALGRFQQVLDGRERALRAARACRHGYPLAGLWIRVSAFYALLLTGDFDAAEALAAAQREEHADDAAVATRAYWTQGLGIVALWRGRVRTAAARLGEAASLLLEYDNGARQLVLFELAVAHALAGATSAAEEALRAAEAARPGLGTLLAGPARARAFVQAARGERSAARATSREAADGFLSSGRVVQGIVALHDAVCFGDGRATAQRLRRVVEATDGPLLRALADHAVARAERDAAGLDAVAVRLASLGLSWHAADAARAACEEHALAGDAAASLASRHRFEGWAARCEAAVFAPLLPPGDPLTRREREVAELAARGASDRDIAIRLSLSVRTVHAHLRSVYDKLAVAGRRELRGLLLPGAPGGRGDDAAN